MTSSVLFGDVMVLKRIFWTVREHLYFVYYPNLSHRRIKAYMVETMDMGRSHWKNVVGGTVLVSIVVSNMILIVRYKILW